MLWLLVQHVKERDHLSVRNVMGREEQVVEFFQTRKYVTIVVVQAKRLPNVVIAMGQGRYDPS